MNVTSEHYFEERGKRAFVYAFSFFTDSERSVFVF
jgi:hypothetical protein